MTKVINVVEIEEDILRRVVDERIYRAVAHLVAPWEPQNLIIVGELDKEAAFLRTFTCDTHELDLDSRGVLCMLIESEVVPIPEEFKQVSQLHTIHVNQDVLQVVWALVLDVCLRVH